MNINGKKIGLSVISLALITGISYGSYYTYKNDFFGLFNKDNKSKEVSNLEITNLIDSFYAEVQQKEGGRWDTSSLFRRLNSQ